MEDWNNCISTNTDVPRNVLFANRPPVVNKYLQFLLIYDEHNALLGATNMGDFVWAGDIWQYNDISDFSREAAAVTKQTVHGVCDAVYLSQNKFVVVGDDGDVEIHQLVQPAEESESKELLSLHCAQQHDGSVLTVSLFPNKRNIITGGMDCCIKIWDVEDLITTYSYSFAHINIIPSIDVRPMCNSIFVSASFSGEALLWDFRQSKPAHCIYEREYPLSAVAWQTASDHLVAIGSAEGRIILIDIRQATNEPLHESVKADRGIHKLLFNPNPDRKEQLACCFDDTPVKVFDSSKEMQLIFEDNTHCDFVRGLAWHKDDLFSCSWDGSVIKHALPSDDK